MATKINWTDETWNPIIGCSKISIGCNNCYAEKMAHRLANINMTSYYLHVVKGSNYGTPMAQTYSEWNGLTNFVVSQLHKPSHWKKQRKIFVCSMGDLFHESVPFLWINAVFSVMSDNDQHIYQILTKRPLRMKQFFEWKKEQSGGMPWRAKDNVWIGVTAENQKMADERIPILLDIPAAKRFVSCEPLLTDIDFPWYQETQPNNETVLRDIDWVIVGGESGTNARPMHPNWVRNIHQQCKTDKTPFFFKQWGEWHESDLQPNKGWKTHLWPDGKLMYKIGKKKAGELLDGIEYKEFPK